MDKKALEEQIINNYKRDETMMILVFAQWCVNNDLDPSAVYKQAYPYEKGKNEALQHAISLTVPKEESEHISPETLLGVLSLFGNDDLAAVVTEEMDKQNKRKRE